MPSTDRETANVGKKRKHDIIPEDEDDKLEIDVSLPEPPSKKAKRKEKKQAKVKSSTKPEGFDSDDEGGTVVVTSKKGEEEEKPKLAPTSTAPPKRSEYGVWIGNLPFAATRDTIRKFLLEGGIGDSDITRVHMPTAEKGQNKGFAYVDFTTPAILDIALTLSERMVQGRSVLIKNSKSFEGRPQKSPAEQNAAGGNISKKEPSKRIFVGNLSFDVTKEELAEHFAQAGHVDNVHMATFEDSGKCKGFAWVTFAEIDAAKNAVRGFVFKDPSDDDDSVDGSEDEAPDGVSGKSKKRKPRKARKWFINRIHGRELRCEFAEDAQTRYKKRFASGGTKGRPSHEGDAVSGAEDSVEALAAQVAAARHAAPKRKDPRMKSMTKDERQDERRKRHDARTVAPGRALANKQRASEAIVAGTGNKKTFD